MWQASPYPYPFSHHVAGYTLHPTPSHTMWRACLLMAKPQGLRAACIPAGYALWRVGLFVAARGWLPWTLAIPLGLVAFGFPGGWVSGCMRAW